MLEANRKFQSGTIERLESHMGEWNCPQSPKAFYKDHTGHPCNEMSTRISQTGPEAITDSSGAAYVAQQRERKREGEKEKNRREDGQVPHNLSSECRIQQE